ncbi:integrase [Roseovarius sp. TE539]|nr:integrase [Roseovarius sp. TE539]
MREISALRLPTPTQESYTVTLIMPRPVKDPKTGIYYIRVRVPADLTASFGRAEVSKSLRTREPAEAKERFATEYAAIQRRWVALRAAPEPIPLKQIVSLAGRVYQRLMVTLENEPGESSIWEHVARLNEQATGDEGAVERWYGPTVDEILLEEGIAIDQATRKRLIIEAHRAWEQATEQLHKRSQGDFSPDPNANRFPEWAPEKKPSKTASGPTLSDLFDRWKKDHLTNGKPENTVRDFAQKLEALKDYLGHEDVERISPREISEWTDHLRHERGLSPKTVSGKYLAAVKTVFHLARSKFLIERDPAKDVSTKIPPKVKSRSSGFTEEEARQVLSAANRVFEQPSNMAHHNKLACRWVPWICAYSGARAGEITQLRKEDLTVVNGIPQLTITPEAGSVKAGMYRNVPAHPHLQEIGLLDFIRSAKNGYLLHFGSSTPAEAVKRSGNARDKIAVWVRDSVGITDLRIQPNHAWRHRFKTVGRNADIAPEYLGDNPDRIQSEAALAKLCGVCPIPASSGKTSRMRLNRGGNRLANAAIYRVAIVRMRDDQRTKAYAARRTSEGKTRREIVRCIKRYIVREIYRALCVPPTKAGHA